jgi:hypothetical protein
MSTDVKKFTRAHRIKLAKDEKLKPEEKPDPIVHLTMRQSELEMFKKNLNSYNAHLSNLRRHTIKPNARRSKNLTGDDLQSKVIQDEKADQKINTDNNGSKTQ